MVDTASLEQWLVRLERLHPNPIDLGLERVASVALNLQLLPVSVPVVTVAGTNGKGSTVAVLEAILGGAGKCTGVYTSPHLLRFNERIRVGGVDASDGEIIAAFREVDDARGDTSLTYFEFATLAALLVFRTRAVDVLVLEVGLGGRLDAVNIVDPTVAVITRIDLDHQAWLGPDRGSIGREKAGILRRGVPAVLGDPEPPAELVDAVVASGAQPVLRLGHEFAFETRGDHWQGTLRGPDGAPRVLPELPLGSLKPANICTGLQAALLVGCEMSDAQVVAAVAAARPRGRCERLSIAGRDYVLDVAHNPAATYNLIEFLSATPCKGKTIAIFSVMADKDICGMIAAAVGSFDAWFVADQPANARAAAGEDVAALLRAGGAALISVSKNLRQALRRAQSVMAEGDRLVVFGSFHTVAGVLLLLDRDNGETGRGSRT
ncbi:MAG: bifunctional tetrahydrofolate synthase/dihydrofolate synthase [Halioglobus sp.]|nr:bifunctional tetrahydrofolate synthase/dihydrofolate synthase [Halioglobus sp.]